MSCKIRRKKKILPVDEAYVLPQKIGNKLSPLQKDLLRLISELYGEHTLKMCLSVLNTYYKNWYGHKIESQITVNG